MLNRVEFHEHLAPGEPRHVPERHPRLRLLLLVAAAVGAAALIHAAVPARVAVYAQVPQALTAEP
jgi:hypothetical protein